MTESGHSSSQTPGWMLELAFMRAMLKTGAQLYVVSEGCPPNTFLQLLDIHGRRYFSVHPDYLGIFCQMCRKENIQLIDARYFWQLETEEERLQAAQRFAYWSQFDNPGVSPEEVIHGSEQ